jgi:lipopolysaccharide transport system ATP-binding protein
MYVRLAFAVAAHLEPEILIVDEVLAVGDAQFQKKCLGKMRDVGREGRTVLFVSHNLMAVRNLCESALLLQQGRLVEYAAVEKVIDRYMGGEASSTLSYESSEERLQPYIKRIEVTQDGGQGGAFDIDRTIKISIELDRQEVSELEVGLRVNNQQGICVQHSSSAFSLSPSIDTMQQIECVIPAYGLAAGRYALDFSLGKRNYQLFEKKDGVINFEVEFTGVLSDKTDGSKWRGICGPGLLLWT